MKLLDIEWLANSKADMTVSYRPWGMLLMKSVTLKVRGELYTWVNRDTLWPIKDAWLCYDLCNIWAEAVALRPVFEAPAEEDARVTRLKSAIEDVLKLDDDLDFRLAARDRYMKFPRIEKGSPP